MMDPRENPVVPVLKAFAESERIFSKAMGLAVDPEVQQYRSLAPSDFEAIRNRFGLEALGRYIRHMEAKILRGTNES